MIFGWQKLGVTSEKQAFQKFTNLQKNLLSEWPSLKNCSQMNNQEDSWDCKFEEIP